MTRSCVLATVLVFLAVPAMAEPIPVEVLEKDRQQCMAGEMANRRGAANYCLCVTLDVASSTSFQRYMTIDGDLRAALSRGLRIDAAMETAAPEQFGAVRRCARHLR